MPLADLEGVTTTFRIDLAGGLVRDTAASIATSLDANQTLGELDRRMVESFHLLLLPPEATGDEIEALAVSVWNEAGWTSPGVLHLTEGATLEGPWTISAATGRQLGMGEEDCAGTVWRLHCPVMRGAAPAPEILRIDEWAQAFPEGVPIGTEYLTLQVLRRVARRLGGRLWLAGRGTVLTPDPDSAINLRFFSDRYLAPPELLALLRPVFPQVQVPPGASLVADSQPGQPYALLVPRSESSRVIVGIRPAQQVPRVLRWESWTQNPLFLIEINWSGILEAGLPAAPGTPSGQLTRSGRLERRRAGQTIGQIARLLAMGGANGAVMDEDDFLVDLAELPQVEAEQRP